MPKSKHYYIRKAHRYLGLILGIQFLLWTIGGLYFSWSNMDEVHGDLQKRGTTFLAPDLSLVSPTVVLDSIKKTHRMDSLVSVQLIEMLGKPYYQIRYMGALAESRIHVDKSHLMTQLADASTGCLHGPVTREEAIAIARNHFNGNPNVKSVEYLATTGGHHEYRQSPLPAYAISFEHPSGTTVYVASELGTVQKFRNKQWRIFDFLWMLHTMDYQSRDNINNTILRIFSAFGLLTVISGFVLYWISSKWVRKTTAR